MGNFSRDTFDKLKHYVGVRLQQGVPLVDADWNEQEDIRRYELRAFLKWFVGNGVPKGNDGFRILPVTDGTKNDFIIKGGDGTAEGAGRCLVEGWDAINESNLKYTAQLLFENEALAEEWVVDRLDPLSPSDSGERTDTVYLDVWEREVDADEDGNLVNSAIDIETCVRLKREWAVRVAIGSEGSEHPPELPEPPTGHVFYPLATLKRVATKAAIEQEDITDRRRTGVVVSPEEITIKDGNVGIGTTDPETKLHVAGGLRLNIGEGLELLGENNYFGPSLDARIFRMIDTNGSEGIVDGGIAIEGFTPKDNGRKPIMAIRGNGNVGIGTTGDPKSKLHVAGGLRLNIGEGLELLGENNYFGPSLDARIFRMIDTNGSEGIVDGGIAIEGFTPKDNGRKPIMAIRGNGNVGIGTSPGEKLHVNGSVRGNQSGALRINTGNGYVDIGPKNTGWSHFYTDREKYYFNKEIRVDSGFIGSYDEDLQLRTQGTTRITIRKDNGDVGIGMPPVEKLDVSGNLRINGDFKFPNTGGGLAVLTNRTFDNERYFQNNNIKFQLGSYRHFIGSYEFIVGHVSSYTFHTHRITNFTRRFSINQAGDLYCAGSKDGYIVDHFVNRVGDTLEQGDVVVISKYQVSHYSGDKNNIPIPEVDLTDRAYDSRVCGIVSKVVTEKDLPYVEVEHETQAEPKNSKKEKTEKVVPYKHPLQEFAAKFSEKLDYTKVQDKQMGKMVTLGAFAHCKVDADIAPIEVGDLLTTSSTKGYAQKVLEPEKAVGAIIGKALGSLKKGKKKIPVLVLLQ